MAFDNNPDLMPHCSGAVKWSGREITSFPLFCTPGFMPKDDFNTGEKRPKAPQTFQFDS